MGASLREIGASLPPGFRFHPSDVELVCHYLYRKIANDQQQLLADHGSCFVGADLVEINLHSCEPWQLPEVAKLNSSEWYFFSFRDRKYATGYRANRATDSGYWKATGKDRTVLDPRTRSVAGMRKTLVFYLNRAPNGIKTDWIMHEFRLENPHTLPKEDWVLCRVFQKSKGDINNHHLSPSPSPPHNNVFESTTSTDHHGACSTSPPPPPPPPNLPSSTPQPLMISTTTSSSYYYHYQSPSHQNPNPSTRTNSSSAFNPNFLQLPQEEDQMINNIPVGEISSKLYDQEDDYRFLLDGSFQDII